MKGTVEVHAVESNALKGNPLGDPSRRELLLYLPPNFRRDGPRLPVVYFLHGFTGSVWQWRNFTPFTHSPLERIDRLIQGGAIAEFIGVFPDGWTGFGGSQWINSAAIGRYRDYLVQDVVPYVDRTFRTIASGEGRAVIGKSSGGYGTMVMGRHHPEVFAHLGCHSGDCYFEYCYLPDFPKTASALLKAGGVEKWIAEFKEKSSATRVRSEDISVINIVAMAAAYSPQSSRPLRLELPFDLETGRLRESVWNLWLEQDPVRFIPKNVDAFRRLRSVFVDCGIRDEFNLRWGTRIMVAELRQAGVAVEHEEFDDGHMSIQYRYDRSLSYLVPKLSRE